MSSSCHCGGNAAECSELERHTGPITQSDEPVSWTFGLCADCRRDRSVAVGSRTCAPCASEKTRAFLASDEAAERAARILGTPMPARRKVAA